MDEQTLLKAALISTLAGILMLAAYALR